MTKNKKIALACVGILVLVNAAVLINGKKAASDDAQRDKAYAVTQDTSKTTLTELYTQMPETASETEAVSSTEEAVTTAADVSTDSAEKETPPLTELEKYLLQRSEETRNATEETSARETEETTLDESMCYVSTTGTKYHSTQDCYVLSHGAGGGREAHIVVISIEEAQWQGYAECDMCH